MGSIHLISRYICLHPTCSFPQLLTELRLVKATGGVETYVSRNKMYGPHLLLSLASGAAVCVAGWVGGWADGWVGAVAAAPATATAAAAAAAVAAACQLVVWMGGWVK